MTRYGFVIANSGADYRKRDDDESLQPVVKSRIQVRTGEIPIQTFFGVVYKAFLKRIGATQKTQESVSEFENDQTLTTEKEVVHDSE